jgi:lysyl-tRNA synthetase class 1
MLSVLAGDVQPRKKRLVPALVGRVSFTGELGYEMWVTSDYQRALYDTLMAAGKPLGIRPIGGRALNSMRLEKSFGSWAREFRPIYGAFEAGLDRFEDEGEMITQSVLGGQAKLQWKVDWAMRWVALGVDYEMYGKDLTDSGVQSGKIAHVLGGRKPEGLIYEMFLDDRGEKISKSKGNGLSLEQWLSYGTQESLAFYAYREPKSAKQLHMGVIPRAVDEYFQFRGNYAGQPVEQQLGNPVHHIHNGQVPADVPPVSFGLLLNLVGVMGEHATAPQVWAYLVNYVPDASAATHPELATLINLALAYNRDFIAPTLKRRKPEGVEVAALQRLDAELARLAPDTGAEAIQNIVYEIGKTGGFENLRDWFKALYETLLGSSAGPRMGSFIALYGIANSRKLIAEALAS